MQAQRQTHIRPHKRQNNVNRSTHDVVRPNLIIVSKGFPRESGDALVYTISHYQHFFLQSRISVQVDKLSILLVGTHASLLDVRAQSLNSGSLHIRIRDVLLALSKKIPICKIRDPSIIRSHRSSIVKTPKRNLNPVNHHYHTSR